MDQRKKAAELKRVHLEWRDKNFKNKKGFFPIFHGFKEHMKTLSPGATSLFLYLGLHSNNLTGETTHSIERMANFFGKSTRTISMWLKELESHDLIERIQLTFNGTSHTFIKPYDVFKKRDFDFDMDLEDDIPF